jgi:hypothetical protein
VKKHVFYSGIGAAAVALISSGFTGDNLSAHDDTKESAPVIFQAAGPNIASIQSMVDQFRAALGAVNNGNNPGPLPDGRREINWDGGGSTATAVAATPFAGFLANRGALFTTNGTGFVQAPVDGLATTFANPSYETVFQAFSPVRLFSPIGSNLTDVQFFVPGGDVPATTRGFGAVFSDVDKQFGWDRKGKVQPSTYIEYYSANGRLLLSSFVPASPGDAGLSFLGVTFDDPRIAGVRIKGGNVAPGAHDGRKYDVVVMDDFLYGEPQAVVKK